MECHNGDEQRYKLILNKLALNSSYGITSNTMVNTMKAFQLELESEQITISEEELMKDE